MCFGWASLHQGVDSLEIQLSSKRRSDPTRPLIFVSHGVGGLLCQLTLLKYGNPSDVKTLLSSTLAMIFFGSSYYDVALAVSPSYATRHAKFCEYSERQLQQELAKLPNSTRILRCHPIDNQEVLLRIETAHVGANNNLHVDSEELHGNHSEMTRFVGQRDPGYQLMLRTVRARLFD